MKSIKDSYKKYKKTKNSVNRKTYLRLSSAYNKFLMEKVLEGKEVVLPARMGTLAVIGREQKIRRDKEGKIISLAPDYAETKKLWKSDKEAERKKTILYHLNPHSDNVRYKYFWSKKKAIIKNKALYSLIISRTNKRAVSKLIKAGEQYMTK